MVSISSSCAHEATNKRKREDGELQNDGTVSPTEEPPTYRRRVDVDVDVDVDVGVGVGVGVDTQEEETSTTQVELGHTPMDIQPPSLMTAPLEHTPPPRNLSWLSHPLRHPPQEIEPEPKPFRHHAHGGFNLKWKPDEPEPANSVTSQFLLDKEIMFRVTPDRRL